MDVDNDVDAMLLQQFSSMGTTDKEVLISEFQKLLGNQLNPAGCAFFLDMNNWNLQAAICAYYDYEQPNIKIPLMTFIKDVTIGDGESIPPNTRFVKTWRVQNTGAEGWPPGCNLKFCNGDQLGDRERVLVEPLEPGQMTDVSIDMISPGSPGIYQGQWRMSTPTGIFFGEVIWVIINVDETGLLGVTQQLSRIGGELSPHSSQNPGLNPFATPSALNQSVSDSMCVVPANDSTIAQQGTPSTPVFPPDLPRDYSTYNSFSQNPDVRTYEHNTEMTTDQREETEMS